VQRGYWALLARVQLPAGERLALARELLKRVYWDRGELLRELRDALPARRRVVARPRTLE
jgi:hypothetical protein